ncbi:oxygen-insensitive NAD(P)H nitroreductase [Duganella callida]|uniref:Oxygen-insensitive NAD(P)H nitroreductase n=1 Tax=Duganella callida TaxID=2561932 RepID=A0A4Y9SXQ6_9BURK|nr:oxygen-insensitive NAD(P)H nitroreductase [Duganella callida]TFW31208.1 oxygen-insensitive NAD(P)H nitroreductase [Duganella callida]
MDIVAAARQRYSTKAYDDSRKVPEEDFQQILDALHLSPSSVNSQPWHFIVASTAEGKARIAKGTQGWLSFNEQKVTKASHVILFCTRIDADEHYQRQLLEQEQSDGRFKDDTARQNSAKGRSTFINLHRFQGRDVAHWLEKQVYLSVGVAITAAAALGIDTTPMEGIDTKALDEEFGLREKGLTSSVVLSFGYRAEGDFNAGLPKSRLPRETVFTLL